MSQLPQEKEFKFQHVVQDRVNMRKGKVLIDISAALATARGKWTHNEEETEEVSEEQHTLAHTLALQRMLPYNFKPDTTREEKRQHHTPADPPKNLVYGMVRDDLC